MKKYNFILFVYIFCSWIFTSCSEEFEQVGEANSRALTMELNAGEQTENGVGNLNENAINNVSVFFFENVTEPCIYLKRNLRVGDDKKLKVDLAPEVVDKTCKVYVVANYTSELSLDELKKMTLAQIQNVVISTDFKTDTYEPYFVMHGLTENAIKITNGGDGGTVLLKRVASKIVLQPKVAESIESDGVTYIPDLTKMTVKLVNVAKKAVLNGGELPEGTTQEFISATSRSYGQNDKGDYVHIPLYSYPNEWANKEGATETYLNFCIPWYYMKNGTQLSANYYYRVAIGSGKLESNKLYRITADIKLLGSIDPEETVKVDASYEILDWKTVDIPADINRYAYLELETNFQEMKNENRVDIGFTSSSETTAKVVKVTYPDYSEVDFGDVIKEEPVMPKREDYRNDREYQRALANYNNELENWNSLSGKLNIYGQTLTFEHTLASTIYVPYTYTIEVTNKDGLTETLEIKQYPPIYIVGESNKEDGDKNRFVYGVNTASDYSETVKDDRGSSLGGVYSYNYSTTNRNPNQYTIYITALDYNEKYIIGDPRGDRNNLSDLQKENGGLKNYYPSKTTTEVDNMVSPAFKIASSFGKTKEISSEQAKKRCASYQENGYPAGRWRVPTQGEINFIKGLSDRGYIPQLFDDGYWSSSQSKGQKAVRCVYDVWYWGDDKIVKRNVFTWGDTDPIRPAK